ncbi:MAG: hypothetical protein L0H31_03295 [Nocardioidaceae bacterium]|nr:hypothetical protein [Nocardioidaceae bacterium]
MLIRSKHIATAVGMIAAAGATWTVPGIANASPSATSPDATDTTGTVTVDGLWVRSAPTTSSQKRPSVDRGFEFTVRCWTPGTSVGGNDKWFAVGPDVGKWVSGNYVETDGPVARCGHGVRVRARTKGDPILNSFSGPSIKDDSITEYQPGSRIRVRCEVSNERERDNPIWYLTTKQEWVPASFIKLKRGTDLEIC